MTHYDYIHSFRDPVLGGDILFGVGGLFMNFALCRYIAKMRMFDHFLKYYLLSICISYIGIILMDGFIRYGTLTEGFPCKRSSIYNTFSMASLLSLTAFSIHLYLNICNPFKSKETYNTIVAIVIVTIIWFISICYTIPFSKLADMNVCEYYRDGLPVKCTGECTIFGPQSPWYTFQISFLVFFLVLMILSISLIEIAQFSNYEKILEGWTFEWELGRIILPMIGPLLVVHLLCSGFEYVTNTGSMYSYCNLELYGSKNGELSICSVVKIILHVNYVLVPLFLIIINQRTKKLLMKVQRMKKNAEHRVQT